MVELSEKMVKTLNDACIKRFGYTFESLYKTIEENEKMKKTLKEQKKMLKELKKLQK